MATAIKSPIPELRHIVMRAAAEREEACPGTGDPQNMLQLRAGAPTNHEVRVCSGECATEGRRAEGRM